MLQLHQERIAERWLSTALAFMHDPADPRKAQMLTQYDEMLRHSGLNNAMETD